MLALLLTAAMFQGNVDARAKAAFDMVEITSKAKIAFDMVEIKSCSCQNCDCVDCKCQNDTCDCEKCNSFEAVYAKSIKDNQVIVLSVGTPALNTHDLPWKVLEVKSITGEKPGHIIGVPKDGKLVRLDFPIGVTRQRMRLDVLHVIYPLTPGYVECATCPQGRIQVQANCSR